MGRGIYQVLLALAFLIFSGKSAPCGTPARETAPITVYIFLSETCPICQSETIELKALYREFSPKGVRFVGLFPNETASDAASVRRFGKKYDLPFTLHIDSAQTMTQQLGATITPQVFVTNATGTVVYQGKIDNGFERIGRRRSVVTAHYLQSALQQLLNLQLPDPASTEAVGCFISKNKKP
ncbi:MAG: redoxin family protein [Chitinophagales bacterium]